MEAIITLPSSSSFAGRFSTRSTVQLGVRVVGAGRRLVVVGARKSKKKRSDSDEHSFVPKADESIGPYPEAVLLKKRTVQEDGRELPEFADAEEEELFDFLSLQLESDLKVDRVRHYEVVYLIHEDKTDEVDSVVSKVEDFVREKKGRIWRLNNWGLRKLAYKIEKASKATYILMNFEIEASSINEFKTMLDRDERVIRHLVIKRDEAITEDCPPPPEFHSLKSGEMEDEDEEDEFDDEMFSDDEDENIIIVDDEVDVPTSTGGVELMTK